MDQLVPTIALVGIVIIIAGSFFGDLRARLREDFYFEGRTVLRRALLRWAEGTAVHVADAT